MTKQRVQYPLVVATLTLAICWLNGRGGQTAAVALLVALILLLLPVLWGISCLWCPDWRWHVTAVAGWLVLAWATTSGSLNLLATGVPVLSGLAIGWTLTRRWRFDVVVVLAALPPVLLLLGTYARLPMDQMLRDSGRDLMDVLQRDWPSATDPALRQTMLADSERGLNMMIDVWVRYWPGLAFLAVLAQTVLALFCVRALARLGRHDVALRRLPPFHRWRMPYYLVWLLAGGLALLMLRSGVTTLVGANVILVVLVILSVQGLAVQSHWLGRYLPAWLRIAFWTVAAILVVPLLVLFLGSALLGLIDQWVDLRRDPVPPGST